MSKFHKMKHSWISPISLFAILLTPVVLPEQLPSRYLVEQGFISFQEPANGFTPIYSSLSIDGVPVNGPSSPQVSQIFSDSTFANIPDGTTIQKLKDSNGREIWNYPIGTEVAHEIIFNDLKHTLFELRLLRKVGDSLWDFASYSPNTTDAIELTRNHYSGNAPLSINLEMSNHLYTKIDLNRINLISCKNCHYMRSQANYQYPSVSATGPCGFTPGNEAGIRNWIDSYQRKTGHSPFIN